MERTTKKSMSREKKDFARKMDEIRPFLRKKYVVPPPTADKWDTDTHKTKDVKTIGVEYTSN